MHQIIRTLVRNFNLEKTKIIKIERYRITSLLLYKLEIDIYLQMKINICNIVIKRFFAKLIFLIKFYNSIFSSLYKLRIVLKY